MKTLEFRGKSNSEFADTLFHQVMIINIASLTENSCSLQKKRVGSFKPSCLFVFCFHFCVIMIVLF